jgi:hypothetical protein
MWRIPLFVLGLYLFGRAIVEPFVIDLNDPATYSRDWGGPHLIGVLAVHCLPGLLAAALTVRWFIGRRRRKVAPLESRAR